MWTYDRSSGYVRNSDGYVLAHVPCALGDESDQQNGELMAAAPAMVEQIKRLCTCLDEAGAFAVVQGKWHNAGMWQTAIREAQALLSGLTVNQ